MAAFHAGETQAVSCAFRNPIIAQGQDPSVVYKDGFYYLVQSEGNLNITKSATITGLSSASPVRVFTMPTGEEYSYDVWAPEIVYLRGEWYIYVAATSAPGANPTHRMYVLKADTQDPMGSWTMVGKVYDAANDKWAIDGVPFEYNGELYFVWSGWPGDVGDFPQNLYIATMSDPTTLSSERVLIAEPTEIWERSVAAIIEGPEPFISPDGVLSIVYSANASWTTAYNLGAVVLTGDDPLNPDDWTKTESLLGQNGAIYGPGHNSIPVMSPDGSEYWNIYHAKTRATDGWGDRAIFAQPFTWDENGVPSFPPASSTVELPSGEPCGEVEVELIDPIVLNGDFADLGTPMVSTLGSFSVAAWVKVDSFDTPMAFISQEGGITSNFVLGTSEGAFSFTAFNGMGTNTFSAASTETPQAGQWVHLAGVHDVVAGEIRLYVNGELQASAPFTAAWDARGSAILGGARSRAQRVNLMTGTLSGVRFYSGALDAGEVGALAEENPPE